jgi:transcriptional regulator with XRE-family HTH domain
MRETMKLLDFKAIGQAVKAARESRGQTREQLAEEMDLASRYIMSIENKGQRPSLQVFYELVMRFDISVDQYFFPDKLVKKTTRRKQLDALLDSLSEKELIILETTARGDTRSKCGGLAQASREKNKPSPAF